MRAHHEIRTSTSLKQLFKTSVLNSCFKHVFETRKNPRKTPPPDFPRPSPRQTLSPEIDRFHPKSPAPITPRTTPNPRPHHHFHPQPRLPHRPQKSTRAAGGPVAPGAQSCTSTNPAARAHLGPQPHGRACSPTAVTGVRSPSESDRHDLHVPPNVRPNRNHRLHRAHPRQIRLQILLVELRQKLRRRRAVVHQNRVNQLALAHKPSLILVVRPLTFPGRRGSFLNILEQTVPPSEPVAPGQRQTHATENYRTAFATGWNFQKDSPRRHKFRPASQLYDAPQTARRPRTPRPAGTSEKNSPARPPSPARHLVR